MLRIGILHCRIGVTLTSALGRIIPLDVGHIRSRMMSLLHWIDKYLADTHQLLGNLIRGDRKAPSPLLVAKHCRERLGQLRREVEDYLYLALDEILPHQDLPGGRKRYEIPFGDDDIRLDLPGCDDPVGLEMVYDWVHSCRSTNEKAQLAALESLKSPDWRTFGWRLPPRVCVTD